MIVCVEWSGEVLFLVYSIFCGIACGCCSELFSM